MAYQNRQYPVSKTRSLAFDVNSSNSLALVSYNQRYTRLRSARVHKVDNEPLYSCSSIKHNTEIKKPSAVRFYVSFRHIFNFQFAYSKAQGVVRVFSSGIIYYILAVLLLDFHRRLLYGNALFTEFTYRK